MLFCLSIQSLGLPGRERSPISISGLLRNQSVEIESVIVLVCLRARI